MGAIYSIRGTIRSNLLDLAIKDILLWTLTVKKENTILLRSLKSRKKRAKFRFADRVFYSIVKMLRGNISRHFTIVKPETVLKWTRNLIKRYWTFPSHKKKRGRPETAAETKQLILEMKNENLYWGIKRIQGELMKVGIVLDKKTISKILREFRRKGKVRKSLTWSQFIKSHLETLYGCDFFTIDTIMGKRCYVFFILYMKSRQIMQYAVTTNPCREFIRQQLIEFSSNIDRGEGISDTRSVTWVVLLWLWGLRRKGCDNVNESSEYECCCGKICPISSKWGVGCVCSVRAETDRTHPIAIYSVFQRNAATSRDRAANAGRIRSANRREGHIHSDIFWSASSLRTTFSVIDPILLIVEDGYTQVRNQSARIWAIFLYWWLTICKCFCHG